MIETVMIFALGFLAASLCALLLLPALNARAARLSQRRIEARLPLSVAEVAAEKDYLRAQFAVAQRRLERKVETVRASRHADLAAIGARTLEAAALTRAVESRDATLAEREAVIASTRETLGGVERDLEAVRAERAIGAATLEVLEEAHRDILEDLLAIRRERDVMRSALDLPSGDAAEAFVTPDLAASHAALVAERETLRVSLATAENALADVIAKRDGETADLRRRITDVAETLIQRERLPSTEAFRMPAGS